MMSETNVCELYDFEGDFEDNHHMFDSMKGTIDTLEVLHSHDDILMIDDLLSILNFHIFCKLEICPFCKGKIKERKYDTIVILHTIHKEAVDIVKKLLQESDFTLVEEFPYQHPYDDHVTTRYRLRFDYFDIVDSLKDLEWQSLRDSIDNAIDFVDR